MNSKYQQPATLITLLALLWLSGCATPAPTAPTPTPPQTLTLALTPALRPWLPTVQACVISLTDTAVFIREAVYPAAEPVDLHLHLGEPSELPAFVAQIGDDGLIIILNPNHPTPTPDLATLQAYYTGQQITWSDEAATTINLWALMPGDESRAAFDHFVLGDARLNTNTRLAADAATMRAAILADPTAIGYLPTAALNDDDIVVIETGITLPVLALADREPQGALYEIVACLQDNNP